MNEPTKTYKTSLFLQTGCYLMTPRWIETVLLNRSETYKTYIQKLAFKLAIEDKRLETNSQYSNQGAE